MKNEMITGTKIKNLSAENDQDEHTLDCKKYFKLKNIYN